MLVSLLALAVTPRPSPAGSPGTFALTVVAGIATVVAAGAALVTVWYARKTVTASRLTIGVAEAARQADERDRLRHRLERVGELLVEIRFGAERVQHGWGGDEAAAGSGWMAPRDRLALALVGLRLPKCLVVLSAKTADEVLERVDNARSEVDLQIQQLGPQDR